MSRLTNIQKGTLLMFLSVLLFSVMQLCVSLTDSSISVYEQVFCRNLFGVFVAGYFIKKDKLSWYGERQYQPYLFGRSFFGFLGIVLSFYAVRNAFLGDATILTRTGPIFTTLFSVLFLKEKLTKIQIPALIICFVGGFIAANPRFDSSFIPLGAAFLSAICNGICYTLLNYFGGKVHSMTVIMHFSTFSMAASIPFMIGNFVVPTGMDLIMLLLIGLFGSAGQICLTYSYRLAPASQVAIYDQLSIVLSMVFGIIFLSQIPKGNSVIGGALVILSSVLVYFYNNYYIRNIKKFKKIT